MRRSRAVILGLGGAVGALAFALGLGWRLNRGRAETGSSLLPLPIGEMSFTLTDHRGRAARPSEWIGRPTMVFFGFTWCPDACPTTLSDIPGWLEELGPDADRLNTILISVDPAVNGHRSLRECGHRKFPGWRVTGSGISRRRDRSISLLAVGHAFSAAAVG